MFRRMILEKVPERLKKLVKSLRKEPTIEEGPSATVQQSAKPLEIDGELEKQVEQPLDIKDLPLDTNEAIAQARMLLAQEPSTEAWTQILDILLRVEGFDLLASYLETSLQHWPSELRVWKPSSFSKDFQSQRIIKALGTIIQTLDLRNRNIGRDEAKQIANSTRLSNISTLELQGHLAEAEVGFAILNSPNLPFEIKSQYKKHLMSCVRFVFGLCLKRIRRYGYPYDEEDVGPIDLEFEQEQHIVFDIEPDGQSVTSSYEPLVFTEGPNDREQVVLTDNPPLSKLVGQKVVGGGICYYKPQPGEDPRVAHFCGYRLTFEEGDVFYYFNCCDDAQIFIDEFLPKEFFCKDKGYHWAFGS